MTFAGLPRAQDRINLIAFCAPMPTVPAPIPAPAPKTAAPAAAPAAGAAPAAAGAAAAAAAAPASATAAKAATPAPAAANAAIGSCRAEKIRAQAGKAERPLHAAAGLGRPGQEADSSRPGYDAVLADRDAYKPEEIDYFVGFRPPPGFLKTLPNLKACSRWARAWTVFCAIRNFPTTCRWCALSTPP